MKSIISIIILTAAIFTAAAQSPSIITYDYPNRGLSPNTQIIPFDRAFSLLVTRFPNTNIRKIYLFEIRYDRNGKRILNKRLKKKGPYYLDKNRLSALAAAAGPLKSDEMTALNAYLVHNDTPILVKDALDAAQEYPIQVRKVQKLIEQDRRNYTITADTCLSHSISKDSLTIFFVPITPSHYFDVQVNTGLTPANAQKVLDLNKFTVKLDTVSWKKTFNVLDTAAMEIDYSSRELVSNLSFSDYDSYYNGVFKKLGWNTLYPKMIDSTQDTTATLFSAKEAAVVYNQLSRQALQYANLYFVTKITQDTTLQPILQGLLPTNYVASTLRTDYFDFQSRISNLDSSRVFFDSLTIYLQKIIRHADKDTLANVLKNTKHISVLLRAKEDMLRQNFTSLTSTIATSDLFQQSYMFGSDDQVADMKTRSAFYLTTDLGFTNIFARDYRNKLDYIPKLFFGANIFFRQVDKSVKFSTLKYRWREKGIIAYRNPLQYLSLSFGLTIGSMSNPDFSNLYNTFSLTIGPSFRFARACRITGGFAFLDRVRANPELTGKQFIVGGFAAFSVDLDFLTPIQKITDLLTK